MNKNERETLILLCFIALVWSGMLIFFIKLAGWL